MRIARTRSGGRTTLQRSLDKLKQGMEDEKKAFEKEWADLGALMEQDRQLQEALRRKEREEHERKTAEALAASKKAEEEPCHGGPRGVRGGGGGGIPW